LHDGQIILPALAIDIVFFLQCGQGTLGFKVIFFKSLLSYEELKLEVTLSIDLI
jgi:hypothetical protein